VLVGIAKPLQFQRNFYRQLVLEKIGIMEEEADADLEPKVEIRFEEQLF